MENEENEENEEKSPYEVVTDRFLWVLLYMVMTTAGLLMVRFWVYIILGE